MSTSPRLSMARRVVDSGTLLKHEPLDRRHLAPVALVRLHAPARRPAVWLTNLYGPRPIGCFLKPSAPTCSTYFFGTIQPAPRDERAVEGHEVRPRLVQVEAHAIGPGDLDVAHLLLEDLRSPWRE